MSELKSVELAIEVATRRRDALLVAYAKVQRSVIYAQGQMNQLEGYALDTDARWVGSTQRALSTEFVRHHYQFMERLRDAIGLQSGVIGNLQQQLEEAHQVLLQAEFRLAGLNQILVARTAKLRQRERRIEQRQMDEFAAMLHARTQANFVNKETR